MTDAQSKAATDAVYYKVKKGDTLGKIAKKHGTTVNAICRLNGITPKKVLQIGQRLRVR
jgi:LysM repeat protein